MTQTYEEYLASYHGMKVPLTREKWSAAAKHRLVPRQVSVPDHIKKALDDPAADPQNWTLIKPNVCKHGWTTCYACNFPAKPTHDTVDSPKHYTSHPSGVECIEITRHMTFNLGNALKYLWRHDRKNGIEDLRKAIWCINDEIKRLEGTPK